jgi:hypothetical protein
MAHANQTAVIWLDHAESELSQIVSKFVPYVPKYRKMLSTVGLRSPQLPQNPGPLSTSWSERDIQENGQEKRESIRQWLLHILSGFLSSRDGPKR